MNKMIIFCADGTWNGPGQDDDEDSVPEYTNVYKLFLTLAGAMSIDSIKKANEQEKELITRNDNRLLQVVKYIHGVGDSHNVIHKILGGAFGAGIISRIVRGYTFISRNYEPNDNIVIVGFSRGAYTARALAGLIASQGLLAKHLVQNNTEEEKKEAYKCGARAWYLYRKDSKKSGAFLANLVQAMDDLPAFLSRDRLCKEDFIPIEHIKAVGVWDTVGALGIPRYVDNEKLDVYRFTDTKLSPIVENGFHAVSLDDRRQDFTPTLWDKSERITQILFPGAHADVGGGYTTKNNESGLSDIALKWMIDQLKSIGAHFDNQESWQFLYKPDIRGTAHKPWLYPPFNLKNIRIQARNFSNTAIKEHPSISERMALDKVLHDPCEKPSPYKPLNRP